MKQIKASMCFSITEMMQPCTLCLSVLILFNSMHGHSFNLLSSINSCVLHDMFDVFTLLYVLELECCRQST